MYVIIVIEYAMQITQEELQNFEKTLRYVVDKYIEYINLYNQLMVNTKRNPEENLELKMLHDLLTSIGEILAIAIRSIGDDLFGKALHLYYHYKQFATKGDVEAQNLIKELKPLLENSLSNRIYMN